MTIEERGFSSLLAAAVCLALSVGACSDSAATGPDGGTPDAAVSCTTELKNADIQGGMTLPAGSCYLVNENLVLGDGTVTAEAGVMLKFATGISFHVKTGGALKLAGTTTTTVRFTSQDPVGTWKGVRLTDSQSTDNSWTYAVVDRAGSAPWTGAAYSAGAVYVDGTTTVAMDHVTISNSEAHGLVAFDKVTLTFAAGTFESNDTPAYLHPQVADAIAADATFTSNTNEHIRLVFGNNDKVEGTHSWPPHRYRVEDRFFVVGDVTIEPGAILEFAQDVSMIVEPGATLTAVGTAAKAVTFKGAADTKGFWKGIAIESGGTGTPATIGATFDHCTISDGGGKNWSGAPESKASLYLEDTSAAKITNTTFRSSGHYALWAGDKARLPDFANNTFTENARVMILHPDRVGELAGNSSITGNDDDDIHVVFNNNNKVSAAATWNNLKVPYLVRDRFFVEAALTIAAGVTIRFPQDRGMIVKVAGSIVTNGTAAEPVVLKGQNEVATGYWQGLRIESNSTTNTLTHTTVMHAGVPTWTGSPDSDAALYIDNGARIALDNVTFGPGGGHGVYLEGANSALDCTAVTFTSLGKGNIWQDGVLTACP